MIRCWRDRVRAHAALPRYQLVPLVLLPFTTYSTMSKHRDTFSSIQNLYLPVSCIVDCQNSLTLNNSMDYFKEENYDTQEINFYG